MIPMIKCLLLLAIFIFSGFSSDKNINQKPSIEEKIKSLHIALQKGNEKLVKSVLKEFNEEEQEKLIEFVIDIFSRIQYSRIYHFFRFLEIIKKNQPSIEEKITSLHNAVEQKNEEFVNSVLNEFNEEEKGKLIEFLMQQQDPYAYEETDLRVGSINGHKKETALHIASYNGSEQIVNSLLNIFDKEDKTKIIEYLMKKNVHKSTALHLASSKGYEKIINSLLNAFGKEENEKLFEFIM